VTNSSSHKLNIVCHQLAIVRVNVKILGSSEPTVIGSQRKLQFIGLEATKQEGSKRTVKVIVSAKGYQEKSENLQFSLGEVVENNIQLTKQNGAEVNKNNTS